jgi:hypothetical protein
LDPEIRCINRRKVSSSVMTKDLDHVCQSGHPVPRLIWS